MKRLSRLSALLFAAAMALAPASAFAQSYTYSPSQSGAVGSIVSATDPGGGTRKVVLPKIICDSGCASPVAFTPTGATVLAVSNASSRVALPSADPTVLLTNNGATDFTFKLGTSGVTAATTDYLLPAGRSIVVAAGANTYVAAITASGSSSLSITTGTGSPTISGGGGSGGGGGAVTVASGADVTEGAITDTTCGASHTVSGCLYALIAAMSTATPAGNNTIGNANVFQNSSGYVIPPAADNSALLNMTTATTTQIVALSSGKAIYVSSYDLNANGTTTANFVYGTGTNCATGATAITSTLNLTAQAGISRGSGLGALFKVPASNALCVVNGSAVNLQADVSFAQF